MSAGVGNIIGKDLIGGGAIPNGSPFTTEPIDANQLQLQGSFSIHLLTTSGGGGEVTVTLEQSNNYDFNSKEGSFVQSSESTSTIVAAFAAGGDFLTVEMAVCKAFRFVITPATADIDTASLWFGAQ